MIAALMQPYFFPYIGYFQLMRAVDCFVFYDDAQYMKGGWINRNRILQDGTPAWWTHPVVRDDHRLPIRLRRYARSPVRTAALLAKLDGTYRTAPEFIPTMALAAKYLDMELETVSSFNQAHLEGIARRLGIDCTFVSSSQLDYDRALGGQSRVIDLCRRLGASTYLNAAGGSGLYDAAAFAQAHIELGFVHAEATTYRQFDRPHVPFLSIIDVLMFNAVEQVGPLLNRHKVVRPAP